MAIRRSPFDTAPNKNANLPPPERQHEPLNLPPDRGPGGTARVGPIPGQSQEDPRDRPTPPRPRFPSPVAGQPGGNVSQAGGAGMAGGSGMTPFAPLASPGAGALALPNRRLFGASRGLLGGGLGVPLDPINDAASDPISSLIQALLARKGSF